MIFPSPDFDSQCNVLEKAQHPGTKVKYNLVLSAIMILKIGQRVATFRALTFRRIESP